MDSIDSAQNKYDELLPFATKIFAKDNQMILKCFYSSCGLSYYEVAKVVFQMGRWNEFMHSCIVGISHEYNYDENNGENAHLSYLPPEIWNTIFGKLELVDMIRFTATCRAADKIVADSIVAKIVGADEQTRYLIMNREYHIFSICPIYISAKIFHEEFELYCTDIETHFNVSICSYCNRLIGIGPDPWYEFSWRDCHSCGPDVRCYCGCDDQQECPNWKSLVSGQPYLRATLGDIRCEITLARLLSRANNRVKIRAINDAFGRGGYYDLAIGANAKLVNSTGEPIRK